MNARPHSPLVSFLGYSLVVVPFGLMISTMVAACGGVGSRAAADAFLYALLICVGMTATALTFPRLFSRPGGALPGMLAGLLLCEIVLLFLGKRQAVTDCGQRGGLRAGHLSGESVPPAPLHPWLPEEVNSACQQPLPGSGPGAAAFPRQTPAKPGFSALP